MGDGQAYHRKNWVALSFPNLKHISREDIREFHAQFVRHRDRVGEYTAEEEYDLVMRKLPSYWRSKVVVEEDKRNNDQQ